MCRWRGHEMAFQQLGRGLRLKIWECGFRPAMFGSKRKPWTMMVTRPPRGKASSEDFSVASFVSPAADQLTAITPTEPLRVYHTVWVGYCGTATDG